MALFPAYASDGKGKDDEDDDKPSTSKSAANKRAMQEKESSTKPEDDEAWLKNKSFKMPEQYKTGSIPPPRKVYSDSDEEQKESRILKQKKHEKQTLGEATHSKNVRVNSSSSSRRSSSIRIRSRSRSRSRRRDHTGRGRDRTSRGRDHTSRGRDHPSRGRDHASRGKDHTSRGRDHTTRGRDHTSRGRDHTTRGRDLKHKGREKDDEHKKKKKKKKENKRTEKVQLEFLASDKFEVAKTPNFAYINMQTLTEPIKPKYYVNLEKLRDQKSVAPAKQSDRSKGKIRYYRRKSWLDYRYNLDDDEIDEKRKYLLSNLDREEKKRITERIQFLHGETVTRPEVLENWFELYELKKYNLNELDKMDLASNQLNFIKSALQFHPDSQELLDLYIKDAHKYFDPDAVIVLIGNLLEEFPCNYLLWIAYAMSIQGRLLKFHVDRIMLLYERFFGNLEKYPSSLMKHLKLLQEEQLQHDESMEEERLLRAALEGNLSPELNDEERREQNENVAAEFVVQEEKSYAEEEQRRKSAHDAVIRFEKLQREERVRQDYWMIDGVGDPPPDGPPPRERRTIRIVRHAGSDDSSFSEYEIDSEEPTSDFEQNPQFDEKVRAPTPAYVANEESSSSDEEEEEEEGAAGGDDNGGGEGENIVDLGQFFVEDDDVRQFIAVVDDDGDNEQPQMGVLDREQEELNNFYNQTDPIMLKIFHNSALFLRQSGQLERFFALLRLALHTNFLVNFDNFTAKFDKEKYLAQYENIILYSGLPINEIWTRYENLKQSYAYLPIVPSKYYNESDSDDTDTDEENEFFSYEGEEKTPYRCVYNEEVTNLVYPLHSEYYMLHLLLITCQLAKVPFITSHCLAEELTPSLEKVGDVDTLEMLLATAGERLTYCLRKRQENRFLKVIHDMAKEMVIYPSFLNTNNSGQEYRRNLSELLIKADMCYRQIERSPKSRIFLKLWFRFERLRLVLDKLNGLVDEEYTVKSRKRLENLMEHETNTNNISLYVEMGLFEYEMINNDDMADGFDPINSFQIFRYALSFKRSDQTRFDSADFWQAHLIYAELLVAQDNRVEALAVLVNFILCRTTPMKLTNVSHAAGLIAANRLAITITDVIEETEREERNRPGPMVDHFDMELYFVPNRVVAMIRAYCLTYCILDLRSEAVKFLDKLLATTYNKNINTKRNRFMREKLYEILIISLQIPRDFKHPEITKPSYPSKEPRDTTYDGHLTLHLVERLKEALEEFPRNLHFLQRWSMVHSVPWYKLRREILEVKSHILPILYLIASARWRYYLGNLEPSDRIMVNTRIYNLLQFFSPNNQYRFKRHAIRYQTLKKSPLYWRLLMRTLANREEAFDSIQDNLYLALDECPWYKAIYLDGAHLVPKEVANLNDIMMENLVRAAMSLEEFDIMRNIDERERHLYRVDEWRPIERVKRQHYRRRLRLQQRYEERLRRQEIQMEERENEDVAELEEDEYGPPAPLMLPLQDPEILQANEAAVELNDDSPEYFDNDQHYYFPNEQLQDFLDHQLQHRNDEEEQKRLLLASDEETDDDDDDDEDFRSEVEFRDQFGYQGDVNEFVEQIQLPDQIAFRREEFHYQNRNRAPPPPAIGGDPFQVQFRNEESQLENPFHNQPIPAVIDEFKNPAEQFSTDEDEPFHMQKNPFQNPDEEIREDENELFQSQMQEDPFQNEVDHQNLMNQSLKTSDDTEDDDRSKNYMDMEMEARMDMDMEGPGPIDVGLAMEMGETIELGMGTRQLGEVAGSLLYMEREREREQHKKVSSKKYKKEKKAKSGDKSKSKSKSKHKEKTRSREEREEMRTQRPLDFGPSTSRAALAALMQLSDRTPAGSPPASPLVLPPALPRTLLSALPPASPLASSSSTHRHQTPTKRRKSSSRNKEKKKSKHKEKDKEREREKEKHKHKHKEKEKKSSKHKEKKSKKNKEKR